MSMRIAWDMIVSSNTKTQKNISNTSYILATPILASSRSIHDSRGRRCFDRFTSLHRHRLGEVARLIDIGALSHRDMIGQQLHRHGIDQRRDQWVDLRQ